MPKPPPTPPSSDVNGVDRDARTERASRDKAADPGKQLSRAKRESIGRPESTPSGN